eukprot:TRINITY_DN19924_c0_g2_i1.p1 TRINITY_DN19924_c0_g2~~TRINITY_DN19924_c0_g2_i1.p1  ORF type:complete len:356 (+),score=59.61 TRINITY_DN19924_c0_g2_i1:95-1162(+)
MRAMALPQATRQALACSVAGILTLFFVRSQTRSLQVSSAATLAFLSPSGSVVRPGRRVLRGSEVQAPTSGVVSSLNGFSRQSSSSGSSSVPPFAASAALVLGVSGAASRRRRRQLSRVYAGSNATDAADDEVVRLGSAPSAASASASKAAQAAPASGTAAAADKGFFSQLMTSPELQEDLKTFFTSLAFALAIRGFLIEPRFIPSESMYPNFEIGDQLTVDKISRNWREFQRRDVVVFNPPEAFYRFAGGKNRDLSEALIKRIVALEGDVVEMKDGGVLYVNGEKQDEPFTNENAAYTWGPYQVPPGNVLVLGDNRNQSLDGHIWGFLPKQNIIGRATLKFWPPWHVGSVPAAPP